MAYSVSSVISTYTQLIFFLSPISGISSLGLELFVPSEPDRLPTVTTIKVPEGVDWKEVTKYAMDK